MKSQEMRDVGLFTLISFLYSWPIFFAVDAWLVPMYLRQDNLAAARLTLISGHLLGMLGPGIAALLLWRVFHRGTPPAWRWSRLKYYGWVVAAALVFWTLPGLVGVVFGDRLDVPVAPEVWIMIAASVGLGWFAGLGEETGWCGYILPHLSPRVGKARAVIVSGGIRGLWHWPVLVGGVIAQTIAGELTIAQLVGAALVMIIQLLLSNILFGAIMCWIWERTKSLPLLGWAHQWFDLARDATILLLVGYGGSLWVNSLNGFILYGLGYWLLSEIGKEEGATLNNFFRPARLQAAAAAGD